MRLLDSPRHVYVSEEFECYRLFFPSLPRELLGAEVDP
jgi:hypothetical protein